MRFSFGVNLEDTPGGLWFYLAWLCFGLIDKKGRADLGMVESSLRTLVDLGVLEAKKLDEFANRRWSQAWRVPMKHFHYSRSVFAGGCISLPHIKRMHCSPGGEVGGDAWTIKQAS